MIPCYFFHLFQHCSMYSIYCFQLDTHKSVAPGKRSAPVIDRVAQSINKKCKTYIAKKSNCILPRYTSVTIFSMKL